MNCDDIIITNKYVMYYYNVYYVISHYNLVVYYFNIKWNVHLLDFVSTFMYYHILFN